MTAELGSSGDVAQAAELVRRAIQILDDARAPSDIAAHLDLALARLETQVDAPVNPAAIHELPASGASEAN